MLSTLQYKQEFYSRLILGATVSELLKQNGWRVWVKTTFPKTYK